MFNTTEIAKRIKQARINKNMTQMNLADEMGVSFQAVSNWERGNSMPDISKLEDLCRVLELTVNELLGMRPETAAAVNKALEHEELSVEELAEVAPMLPPEDVRKQVEDIRRGPGTDKGFLSGISNMLKDKFSGKASETREEERSSDGRKKKVEMSALAGLAPFLDEEYLDELVMAAAEEGSLDGIEELAPFLSSRTLEKLAEQVQPENLSVIAELAPFLSEKALDGMVRRCVDTSDTSLLEALAPFVSEQTLDTLADQCLERNDAAHLENLYPFMSQKTLKKIAGRLMENRDLDALEDIMPFV